jgi:hypothetical protein
VDYARRAANRRALWGDYDDEEEQQEEWSGCVKLRAAQGTLRSAMQFAARAHHRTGVLLHAHALDQHGSGLRNSKQCAYCLIHSHNHILNTATYSD